MIRRIPVSPDSLLRISRRLAKSTGRLSFVSPVSHVYAPLEYARAPHELYLSRFGIRGARVILLGMNPGPFGMAQTGVPFGEVALVRDWMGIEAPVSRPSNEHPKRPVEGFGCTRSEVSGRRLWGWARDRFGTPDRFFEQFFVWNYCPLAFLEESGRNRTPDKLPAGEREKLFEVCDASLLEILDALSPEIIVGVGAFAESRARAVTMGSGMAVGSILHPSPASPAANRGWSERAEKQLRCLGVELGSGPRNSRTVSG